VLVAEAARHLRVRSHQQAGHLVSTERKHDGRITCSWSL
jgi:hypothetical protein